MNIAVVAPGEVGRYLIDALVASGHSVTAITRSPKPWLIRDNVAVHISSNNYSLQDLTDALKNCAAAVCTVNGSLPTFAAFHQTVLAACRASPKCRRLIPSTWTGNIADFPDEPLHWGEQLQELFAALRSQPGNDDDADAVEWTAVCPGWFADYVLPLEQRYFGDAGDWWPQNPHAKIFTMPGKGTQLVNLTAARDAAKAVVALLELPRGQWDEYTYISGEQVSWRRLYEFIKARDDEYTCVQKSLAQSIRDYVKTGNAGMSAAVMQIWAHSDAMHFEWARVLDHRSRYFQGIRFRTLAELVQDAERDPGRVP